jgi:hypothetical protein
VADPIKQKFALALAKDPAEAWAAARTVWPDNVNYAVWCYQNWPSDPEVQAYLSAVKEALGSFRELPTEHEYAVYLWKLAKDAPDEETRLKYLRLYAEATGQLKRPQGEGGGVTVNQNRVMVVQHMGEDKDWEAAARAQQQALQRELEAVAEDIEVLDE